MQLTTTLQTEKEIISKHGFAQIEYDKSNLQKALHSLKKYKAGDVITTFNAGETTKEATYLTVQVGIKKHITLEPTFLQYINHSCTPTVFFNTTTFELVALKDLRIGEEFTFFYPSTEWQMAQPFTCNCKQVQCLKIIRGAYYLTPQILQQYKLTNFIQQQLAKKLNVERA